MVLCKTPRQGGMSTMDVIVVTSPSYQCFHVTALRGDPVY